MIKQVHCLAVKVIQQGLAWEGFQELIQIKEGWSDILDENLSEYTQTKMEFIVHP